MHLQQCVWDRVEQGVGPNTNQHGIPEWAQHLHICIAHVLGSLPIKLIGQDMASYLEWRTQAILVALHAGQR